jgi:hypothetical protein
MASISGLYLLILHHLIVSVTTAKNWAGRRVLKNKSIIFVQPKPQQLLCVPFKPRDCFKYLLPFSAKACEKNYKLRAVKKAQPMTLKING